MEKCRCEICGEIMLSTRVEDYICFYCSRCSIPFFVYAPLEPPKPNIMRQDWEKPSFLSLVLPFAIICVLEVAFQLFF